SNRQDGDEALVDAPVKRFFAPAFDFPPLLSRQDYRFHGRLLWLFESSFRSPFPLELAYCTRRFSFGDGIIRSSTPRTGCSTVLEAYGIAPPTHPLRQTAGACSVSDASCSPYLTGESRRGNGRDQTRSAH